MAGVWEVLLLILLFLLFIILIFILLFLSMSMPSIFRNIFAFAGRLSPGRVLLLGLFCAVAIEAVTVFFRFALGLQSTRDTGAIGAFTFGLRIHHGYLGILLVPIALCFRNSAVRNLLLVLAVGLFVSDLFHHFLVLWPIYGDPQFHIFYPVSARLTDQVFCQQSNDG